MKLLLFLVLAALLLAVPAYPAEVVETFRFSAAEANQAAAADTKFVYAIDSTKIVQYDRASGQRIAESRGPAHHLNSGFLWEGCLYCAHSNYPQKPEQSELMVLNPATMLLTTYKDLGAGHGSLTWAVREGDSWWCTFAHYGTENAQTALVCYDAQWHETGVWSYPAEVIADLGRMSISGGVWRKGELLVTGHDKPLLYRLRVPAGGGVLELVEKMPAPFPGQGIALDPVTNGFIGIDRKKRQVVFGEWRE